MTGNQLILHLDPAAHGGGIAGRLHDDRGVEHQFTGWLGLLTLLEEGRLAIAGERIGDPDDHLGSGA